MTPRRETGAAGTAARLVLFDIDGTLLLTAGAGRRAITAALLEFLAGTVPGTSPETIQQRLTPVRFDGKTDPQIVTELLEAAGDPAPREPSRIAAVCQRYTELLEMELSRVPNGVTVMPGIAALLDALDQQGSVVLGLLTGNVARGAGLKLRAAGLDATRFRVGAYGSDSAHRPDLPPIATRRAEAHFGRRPYGPEVVIVGDTPADVACGSGVGARAVAVATGSYSLDDLLACEPHAAFTDLTDTDAVLAAILD
jgi:phosphoglycolate phosphatase-like HAD superfamily hydrolase